MKEVESKAIVRLVGYSPSKWTAKVITPLPDLRRCIVQVVPGYYEVLFSCQYSKFQRPAIQSDSNVQEKAFYLHKGRFGCRGG